MRPFLASLLLVSACGGGQPPGDSQASPAVDASTGTVARSQEIRELLEAGLAEAAWTLLERHQESLGIDGALLAARAALLDGDAVGALREVEDAKGFLGDPPSPELVGAVRGLEIEVLVGLDRLEDAREALREAWKEVGRTAGLERARGLLLIRTPGGAREGLTALEAARLLDPELPFLDFPSSQAHWLVGREALAAGAADQALAHALLARGYDEGDPEFRELEAESRVQLLDFERALTLYTELEAEGRELGDTIATLWQRYGTWLLLEKRRPEAVEAYAHARGLGLGDEYLGFGADVLDEEALKALDRGIASYEAGDRVAAGRAFERALGLDPGNLEALHHLGALAFEAGDPAEAARRWRALLDEARRSGTDLPDPVHLNLARALKLAGDVEGARATLSEALDADPEGPWAEDTRELLFALEAELAAQD